MRRLYEWTLGLAAHPRALWALALIAFLESSVFPIPPDVLILPMVIAAPRRGLLIATVALAASVAGGMLGYAIGALAYDSIGARIIAFYGLEDGFARFRETYNQWGAWAVLIAGVTPFPYKVITILSGLTGLDLGVFTLSSIIARGLRFFLLAGLLMAFGEPIRAFIERRFGLVSTLFVLLLLGGFAALRFL
ncbi:MAG: DedA family protein [Alphaproteobacteria bacterium]|nr:MAG: DedA family protein [Alphaproteobacteria bacterium]